MSAFEVNTPYRFRIKSRLFLIDQSIQSTIALYSNLVRHFLFDSWEFESMVASMVAISLNTQLVIMRYAERIIRKGRSDARTCPA